MTWDNLKNQFSAENRQAEPSPIKSAKKTTAFAFAKKSEIGEVETTNNESKHFGNVFAADRNCTSQLTASVLEVGETSSKRRTEQSSAETHVRP
jgi:hypothetical protein